MDRTPRVLRKVVSTLPSRPRSRDPACGPRPDALLTLCVLWLTDFRIVIGESDAMRTTDIERREMMFACPRCPERETRELERQGVVSATSPQH